MKTPEEVLESRKIQNRKYYLANREKRLASDKAYYIANKERINSAEKKYRESLKDGLFTVYCLPKENYVGMTTQLKKRLRNHINDNGRNTTGVYVLGKYATKKEALAIEASYHAKGYLGRNSTYK